MANESQKPNQLSAEEFVEFLKDPANKLRLHEFLVETYKNFEAEKISRLQARIENEKRVDDQRLAPHHTSGNLSPMMAETFNMHDTERTFARGLNATQKNLVRSVEDRVEEVNHLLSGLGGFSSQLKSCFARSTVVFLEEEDPKHSFRERLIFSINLPNYELQRPWEVAAKDEPQVKRATTPGRPRPQGNPGRAPVSDTDPRTPLQATWDDAVNSLAAIISSTGLEPKYVKNDRQYGRFVMKQDLRSTARLPDEYFSLTLDYNTQERIQEMCVPYNRILREYEEKIAKAAKKLSRWPVDSTEQKYLELRRKHLNLVQERDFFVGTTPDPNNLSEGLLFLIEVSTLKDYHIVKDRMQAIMTKYILHLSKLAANEAAVDPDLEYEMWKMNGKGKQAKIEKNEEDMTWADGLTAEDIASVPEYLIDENAAEPFKAPKAPVGLVQPIKKKKAA